jgi:hypothetical protein
LLAGPAPLLRSFLEAAVGSTLNQSLRVLGNSAASSDFLIPRKLPSWRMILWGWFVGGVSGLKVVG